MRCKIDYDFIITGDDLYIELRNKDGSFVQSICCTQCVDELEEVIKKFKERRKNNE